MTITIYMKSGKELLFKNMTKSNFDELLDGIQTESIVAIGKNPSYFITSDHISIIEVFD